LLSSASSSARNILSIPEDRKKPQGAGWAGGRDWMLGAGYRVVCEANKFDNRIMGRFVALKKKILLLAESARQYLSHHDLL